MVLAMGLTAFAQNKIQAPVMKQGKADKVRVMAGKEISTEADRCDLTLKNRPVVMNRWGDNLEQDVFYTTYDLQSNSYVGNRMWAFDDGTLGATATFSHLTSGYGDRGTGYNYFDGNSWGEQPNSRVESIKTGWPSYAQYGDNGEIMVAHTGSNLVYKIRETKGVGEWSEEKTIPNPDLGLPTEFMTWPRVTTTGPHHNIIHVIAADQADGDNTITPSFYARSTDGENWTVTQIPLTADYDIYAWSADDYCIAGNGNTVAILLTASLSTSTFVIKSDDNGETWEKIVVWQNPYEGHDWATDPESVFTDTLFAPEHGTIAVDKNGKVHCAFSVKEIIHDTIGTSYTFWQGFGVDGIRYWNEDMGPIVDRERPEYEGMFGDHFTHANQHHALKLWWPVPDDPGYIQRDLDAPWVGFISSLTDADGNDISNDKIYSASDYYNYWMGCSAHPAICIDDDGIIAVAYDSPDLMRVLYDETYYYRSVYVTYIDTEGGLDIHYFQDNLCDEVQIMHMMDECINVSAAPNTKNNQFWFSYTADGVPGLSSLTNVGTHDVHENLFYVTRITPQYDGMKVKEVVNPINVATVYPNPVESELFIDVNACQASDMNIAVYNITGQKVLESNAHINAGISKPSINVSSLSSGIYFVTLSANGFEETLKFVVK